MLSSLPVGDVVVVNSDNNNSNTQFAAHFHPSQTRVFSDSNKCDDITSKKTVKKATLPPHANTEQIVSARSIRVYPRKGPI